MRTINFTYSERRVNWERKSRKGGKMPSFNFSDSGLFRPDSLSWVMAGLIVFVIANVTAYSSRYMAGDRDKKQHHLSVLLLGASVLVTVFADHLLLLLAGWVASELLLVRLMIHKA